mgnify:CR=1 FL=1
MTINRNNYEMYFLDYLEGNLDPVMEEELKAFLANHPDLSAELVQYRNITLSAPDVHFPYKHQLRKNPSEPLTDPAGQFAEFAIAFHEHDLSNREREVLDRFLEENPEKRKELDQYARVYLHPDLSVTFPSKSGLKRFRLVPQAKEILLAAAGIAAAVLITVLLWEKPSSTLNRSGLTAQIDTVAVRQQQKNPDSSSQKDSMAPEPESVSLPERQKEASRTTRIPEPVIRIEIAELQENEDPADAFPPLSPLPRKEGIYLASNEHYIGELTPKPIHGVESGYRPLSLSEFALYKLKKSVLGEDAAKTAQRPFSMWDLADAGVRGVNRLMGWEMKLEREYNENGQIEYLAFESGALQFTHHSGE